MRCKLCGSDYSSEGRSALCSACRKKMHAAAGTSGFKAPPKLPSEGGAGDKPQSRPTLVWRAESGKGFDLRWPIAVAVRPGSEIVVLDQPDDYRLLRFDERGRFLGVLAQIPTGDVEGELSDPQGLCSDGEGRLYIADAGTDRIAVWQRDGSYLQSLGGTGSDVGKFARPADVDVDEDGFIYVADMLNRRIQKLSPDGLPCLEITEGLIQPVGVAVNAAQEIFAVDFETNRLCKFNADGTRLSSLPAAKSTSGLFQGPGDVRVGPDGRIYVSDRQNLRVHRLAPNGAIQGTIALGGDENAFFEGGNIAVLNDRMLIPDRFNDRLLCVAFA